MKLARTDRERVRATTFKANYTPSPDIVRGISIEKTREKKGFKLRLEGRSRVGRTDKDRERLPQGADAHEVGVAKGRGPRGKETKVETGRTTTRTRRGKLDKLGEEESRHGGTEKRREDQGIREKTKGAEALGEGAKIYSLNLDHAKWSRWPPLLCTRSRLRTREIDPKEEGAHTWLAYVR